MMKIRPLLNGIGQQPIQFSTAFKEMSGPDIVCVGLLSWNACSNGEVSGCVGQFV